MTSGLYRSTDGGDNWEQLTNGLPESDEELGRIGITVSKSDPNIVYAVFSTNSITNEFEGLYKSTDGGDSWIQTNDNAITDVYASFGWFFGNVRVHPENPDIVLVMGQQLVLSIDGGNSWQNITAMHVDMHGLEFHPMDPEFIVVGNDGGVYLKNTPSYTNWTHMDNMAITQFYNIEVDYQNPQNLYGGTQDNNTIRTNGAIDGFSSILGGDGFHVIVDPTNSNTIYAEYQWGNLFRSFDGGNSMEYALDGVDGSDRTNWNTPVVISPFDPNILYYGSNYLYVSQQADFWNVISDDLTDGQHPSGSSSFGTITTIAPSYNNLDVIYVGTDDGNVQVTFDSGATWTNISDGIPDRYVTRVVIDPNDDLTVFVTLSGFKSLDYMPHVLKSTDGGQSWEDISGNLPEIPVNDFVIDDEFLGTYYLASDLGVWYTQDYGATWEVFGCNLPMTIVSDIKIHNSEETKFLLAGTFGRSMYQIDLPRPISSNKEIVNKEHQIKIAPNPVLDQTQLTFDIPNAGQGKIQILNVMGQVVQTTYSGIFNAGMQSKDINLSNLSKGNYIVRLAMEDVILTQKMVKQ